MYLQSSAMWWASPTRPSSTGYWLRCWETPSVRTKRRKAQTWLISRDSYTEYVEHGQLVWHTLPLFIQTPRWRSGWISTAGRRTRKDRSSSSTRRRASSPRTSSRRSTLRVSAAAQTDCRRTIIIVPLHAASDNEVTSENTQQHNVAKIRSWLWLDSVFRGTFTSYLMLMKNQTTYSITALVTFRNSIIIKYN